MSNPSVLDDVNQPFSEESDFSKVVDLMLNPRYRNLKSVIKAGNVHWIAYANMLGQVYDVEFLKGYVEQWLELQVSVKGRGRDDIVNISKFQYGHDLGMGGLNSDDIKKWRK